MGEAKKPSRKLACKNSGAAGGDETDAELNLLIQIVFFHKKRWIGTVFRDTYSGAVPELAGSYLGFALSLRFAW
jgi:hypothetical protein